MKSWLFTIVRNVFYTSVRKAQRERPGLADCASNRLSVKSTPGMVDTQQRSWRGNSTPAGYSARGAGAHHDLGQFVRGGSTGTCSTVGTIKSRMNRGALHY